MDVFEKVGRKLNAGIVRLDEDISGGFPDSSIILVSGISGSAKTMVWYHYIKDGLAYGERCLYLTFYAHVEKYF